MHLLQHGSYVRSSARVSYNLTLSKVAIPAYKRSIVAWIYVPIGLFAVLAFCFGVDRIIDLAGVSFPASVACMILLFLGLILSEFVLGNKLTKKAVDLIDIPVSQSSLSVVRDLTGKCGFALRYINLFFCPAFVTLPLSPSISGVEVAKIIAVFGKRQLCLPQPVSSFLAVIGYFSVFIFTAYTVRGMQMVLGSSKRAITERAEEMGSENDAIPLTEPLPSPPDETSAPPSLLDPPDMRDTGEITTPSRAQDPATITGTCGPPVASTEPVRYAFSRFQQDAPALSRSQRWATTLTANLDILTYSILFLVVGLPVYYAAGYAMPIQLCINIVCFLMALKIPLTYRGYLHPVLVSSAFSIVIIWLFTLIHRSTLRIALEAYSTGSKYTEIWADESSLPLPGAGDIFGSVLDVSIVALGLPMFQFRQELKDRFLTIIIPNVSLSVGSLLAYPSLCHLIGINSKRSLAFASRSLTLALAIPATKNLGGDLYTVAPLCIFSGIFGVLVGVRLLNALKIAEGERFTL